MSSKSIFYALSIILIGASIFMISQSAFASQTIDAESQTAATLMYQKGVTKVSPDQTNYTEQLSRKYGIFLLGRFIKNNLGTGSYDPNKSCAFIDMESAVADEQAEMIAYCRMGLIKGFNGYVSPENKIMKSDALTIMARALSKNPSMETSTAYDYLLQNKVIIFDDRATSARPIMRKELYVIIMKVMSFVSGGISTLPLSTGMTNSTQPTTTVSNPGSITIVQNGQPATLTLGAVGQSLSSSQITMLKHNSPIQGDKASNLTIIVYSDLDSNDTIKQYQNKDIDTVVEFFGGAANFLYKPYEGYNRTNSKYKALASLCARQLGGESGLIGMYRKILGGSTIDSPSPISKINTYAAELSIPASTLTTCISDGTMLPAYNSNLSEYAAFTNTPNIPGVLMINSTNGKRKLLQGYHYAYEYIDALQNLM